jgi:hypothetical protein
MKKTCFQFLILLMLFFSCKTTKPLAEKDHKSDDKTTNAAEIANPIDFHDQTTWLLGYFNPDQLTHSPYSTWYLKGFDDYQIKYQKLINKLLDINKGRYCDKSCNGNMVPRQQKRGPRFMKVLNAWQFPASKVTIHRS